MELHLEIDSDQHGTIEIDLHTSASADDTPVYLTYRRRSNEETGGEAFNVAREQSLYPVSAETLAELHRLLPKQPLPRPANEAIGIDGATFTLTIGRGAATVEYVWRSQPPREWQCLGEIVGLLAAGRVPDL